MSKTGQCVAVFGCHNSNKTLLVENVIKGIVLIYFHFFVSFQ